ncbi:MAG: DUF4093 domain-containing protein [Clostridia bacterium]|nr:DUF4093 domain-containing protein [Clostridia bacterium]
MKPRCRGVVVVEGKYDRIRLASLLDADILTTEGFGVFKDEEKRALLTRLAREKGLILLLDPDGAGQVIRSFLHNLTGGKGITDLYVPPRPGKEKRKAVPGKEGILGVEGMDNETLLALFEKAGVLADASLPCPPRYTKGDLYRLGYSGGKESREKRRAVLAANDLPLTLSANAFLDVVNLLGVEL